MKPPPAPINGAHVLWFTPIDKRHRHTGNCRQIVAGELQGPAEGLAICQYAGEDAFYLFGCDANWNATTDTCHRTVAEAKQQAEFEYEGVSHTWLEMPVILATITLVPTEAGGRRTPILSGYRPQFYFDGEDYECRSVEIIPERSLSPGETANVRIRLSEFARAALRDRVEPGMTFELHEGRTSVASGVVTRTSYEESEIG